MSYKFPFSPAVLDNLPSPNSGFDVVQDVIEPKLRLYITSNGVRTFFTRKRVHGRDVRIIIGSYPKITIDDARNAVNPVIKIASAPIKIRKKGISLEKVIDMWLNKKIRRDKASKDKLMRSLSRHLAPFAGRCVREITTPEISEVIAKISENSGVNIANKMLESLGSIMKYAIEMGYISENPTDKIERYKENRRQNSLNITGLRRLINAFNKEENPTLRNAFLMLVYGFSNRSAIFSMQWRDLDFNQYTWRGRPLSDRAILLLGDLPQTGKWVFMGRLGKHLTDPRLAWANAVSRAKLPNVQMGDIYKLMSKLMSKVGDFEDLRRKMNDVILKIDAQTASL